MPWLELDRGGLIVMKRLVNLLLPLVRHRPGAAGLVGRQPARCPICRRRCGRGRRASSTSSSRSTKRGEMDQGIVLLAYYSLVRVAQGFLLGIAIAHAARVPARRLADADADVRSAHAGAAADLAAGLAAARPGAVPEVRAGGALRDRRLLDVADGHQHDDGRARHPAGLLERRQGAAAVARRRRS